MLKLQFFITSASVCQLLEWEYRLEKKIQFLVCSQLTLFISCYLFLLFFLLYVDFWNDHDRRVKEVLTKPAITFQWLCLQPTSGTLVVTEACIAFHIPRSFLNIKNWCFDTFSFSCSWVQTCWHFQNGQSARSFHMCRVHCNYYSYSAWLLMCRSWL